MIEVRTVPIGTYPLYLQGCGSGAGSGKFSPDPDPNRAFTHFQVDFSIFSDKNIHHSNIKRNLIDVKKF